MGLGGLTSGRKSPHSAGAFDAQVLSMQLYCQGMGWGRMCCQHGSRKVEDCTPCVNYFFTISFLKLQNFVWWASARSPPRPTRGRHKKCHGFSMPGPTGVRERALGREVHVVVRAIFSLYDLCPVPQMQSSRGSVRGISILSVCRRLLLHAHLFPARSA